ncbi:MAG: hypothetical protein ACKOS8_06790 [Gemmataceae bacterium]
MEGSPLVLPRDYLPGQILERTEIGSARHLAIQPGGRFPSSSGNSSEDGVSEGGCHWVQSSQMLPIRLSWRLAAGGWRVVMRPWWWSAGCFPPAG